ncbi:MAG: sulfatase-like hydrolase/transferase [Rhizobiales bacterium]|nr:sulfatase-like hydrolase/transferase [Hyphomicrobiales bacterium]
MLNIAALAIMAATEVALIDKAAFLLFWGALVFSWIAVLRRPAAAVLLALTMIVTLVLLSQFKHDKLLMTVNFVDVMIIDADTSAFLLTVFPHLRWPIAVGLLVALPVLILSWRLDPFRVRLRAAAFGSSACAAGLTVLSLSAPAEFFDQFFPHNYVSKFARSGVEAVAELATRGLMESDAVAAGRLNPAAVGPCSTDGKPPHIIMLHDESSFDITAAPGIKVPPGYQRYFQSFDGKARKFVVEGAGGPSWFTEYNVLTGLSTRSFGRFADSVTRVAAGRVERGLPHALRRCGYKTFSLYPFLGAFVGARAFQTSAGIEHFLDMTDMGAQALEPDGFYFDYAARLIARERGSKPLFLFVYTAANHFPWNFRFRADLTPDWRDPGNEPAIDEYVRRQTMTVRDYAAFVARLKSEFPGESFLIVRYGDHQPEFGYRIVEPALDEATIARRLEAFDPRYFTSYYAIDTVNFRPKDLSSALETLDAAYLPIVIQDAAGVPLDPAFAEQKKILKRCHGFFYQCAQGAEAKRFNRLLIDAGLIKGL